MHITALSLLFGVTRALLVPPPSGPYAVAVKHVELVDESRMDPFSSEPNTRRRIMVSAYLPIDAQYGCAEQTVPYMPPLTAKVFSQVGESLGVPQGVIEEFEMKFCDMSTISLAKTQDEEMKEFPVAIFSPGKGGTRLAYGAQAKSVASFGYIIITVDHTYEAAVVEFPDGTAAYAQSSSASNQSVTLLQLEVRTDDESFLVSQLSNNTVAESIFVNFPGTIDPLRIAVYGHSLGGATAAETALRDSRVIGGINFDGTLYGSVADEGIKDKPFVLVSNDGDPMREPVPDFSEFYGKIDAPKMDVVVRNTQHYAFTDVPLLLTVYKIPPESQPMIDQVFGTLKGNRVEKARDQVTVGLLEYLFKNTTQPLKDLSGNPDINIRHSNLGKCK